MKKSICTYLIIIGALSFVCNLIIVPPLASQSAVNEIERIQKAYEDIQDISGSFIQKSHIKDLKNTKTFIGQFFIKMPMKMKWYYSGVDAQEVYINNDDIIIYQKNEKQAFRSKFDIQTYGQVPIALLGGFGNIEEEFSITIKNEKLLLKPKKRMEGIVSIEMSLSDDKFPIQSLTIYDIRSNRIEIILKDVKINSGLKDEFFTPKLPKNVNIYEYHPVKSLPSFENKEAS